MTDTVRVLDYGSADVGKSGFDRLGMYRDRLAGMGVEIRAWSEFGDSRIHLPAGYAGRLADAIRDGVAELDRRPIDWADVILFRRWYSVSPACATCDTTGSSEMVAAHCLVTGHSRANADQLLPLLLSTIEGHPEVLRGRAIVYETDDDLLAAAPPWPFGRRLAPDRPIIERLLRRADLVTVATPVLAQTAGRYNDAVRVVRNAADPEWFKGADASRDPAGGVRMLHFGGPDRVADYELCREAVDGVAAGSAGARRCWLGSDDPRVRALADESRAVADAGPEPARALMQMGPDIGLAPVADNDFGRARSESEWLYYSLAGAVTVASRTTGSGPFDVRRLPDEPASASWPSTTPTLERRSGPTPIAGPLSTVAGAPFHVTIRAAPPRPRAPGKPPTKRRWLWLIAAGRAARRLTRSARWPRFGRAETCAGRTALSTTRSCPS
jgi:hypothetical protein